MHTTQNTIAHFLMRPFWVVFLLLCLFCASSAFAQDPNAKLKAIYIQNFTKYIDWPSGAKQGDFVIGVVGESPITPFLQELAKTVKKDNQTIVIKLLSGTEGVQSCHLLFIASDKSAQLGGAINKLKGSNTLIVTEGEGLAKKGSAINFVLLENKIKFELNKSNAEKYGIQVSSKLEPLAIKVD
jgi:hypothetical protein